MKRLQISLEPELDELLAGAARREGVSKAEIVRRSVRREVRRSPSIWDDPTFALFGEFESDPSDTRSIDDVVYGPRE